MAHRPSLIHTAEWRGDAYAARQRAEDEAKLAQWRKDYPEEAAEEAKQDAFNAEREAARQKFGFKFCRKGHVKSARRRQLIGRAIRRLSRAHADLAKLGVGLVGGLLGGLVGKKLRGSKLGGKLGKYGIDVESLINKGAEVAIEQVHKAIERKVPAQPAGAPADNPSIGETHLTPAEENLDDLRAPDPPGGGAFIDTANYFGAGQSALNRESIGMVDTENYEE